MMGRREAKEVLKETGYCLIHGVKMVLENEIGKEVSSTGKKKKKSASNNGVEYMLVGSGRKMRVPHELVCPTCVEEEKTEKLKRINEALTVLGFRKKKRVKVTYRKKYRDSYGYWQNKMAYKYKWKFVGADGSVEEDAPGPEDDESDDDVDEG